MVFRQKWTFLLKAAHAAPRRGGGEHRCVRLSGGGIVGFGSGSGGSNGVLSSKSSRGELAPRPLAFLVGFSSPFRLVRWRLYDGVVRRRNDVLDASALRHVHDHALRAFLERRRQVARMTKNIL